MQPNRQHIVFLDYARAVSCLTIIFCHAMCHVSFGYHSGLGCNMFVSGQAHIWASVYIVLARIGVPVFFMISAWLLLPVGEDENIFDFYRRRLTRILLPFLLFSVYYALEPALRGVLDLHDCLPALKSIPFTFSHIHLWYIYILTGLYLFIPVISPWLRRATAREELMFIALFGLTSTVGFIHHVYGNIWGEAGWNPHHGLWYFSGYMGYFVTAHYIKTHLRWSPRRRIVTGLTLAAVMYAIIYAVYYTGTASGIPGNFADVYITDYVSLPVVLMSVSVFIAFTGITATRTNRMISEVSRHSYGIYLIHIAVMIFVYDILYGLLPGPFAFKSHLFAALTFVLSFAAVKALSYLPYAKFLIGSASQPKLLIRG